MLRRLWLGIRDHRVATVLFAAYWALACVLHVSRWSAPKDTDDIAPPVLLLYALLPFVAGLLAGRWHGPSLRRIWDGLLAGALVMFVDSPLLVIPSIRGWADLQEVPEFWAFFTLTGALLGSLGAVSAAAFGGKVPSAEPEEGGGTPAPRSADR